MNPEQQRIAIAEACGWKFIPSHDNSLTESAVPECWFNEETDETVWEVKDLDDYLYDLNAMQEAEKHLDTRKLYTEYEKWLDTLSSIVGLKVWESTASIKAEAFLRTIGKWTE